MVSGKVAQGWDAGGLLLPSGVPERVPCLGWPCALADGSSLHRCVGGERRSAARKNTLHHSVLRCDTGKGL